MTVSAQRLIERLDDPRAERFVMLAILGLALAVRVVVAWLLPDQSAALLDSIAYRMAGAYLASTYSIANEYMMPGYPLLIALTGAGIGQIAADIALSVLSVWCVARIVRAVSGDTLGAMAAGLIWALYPFSLFYAAVGLTETMYVAMVLLGFLALYRNKIWLGSIALMLSILTRPSIEILSPLLIVAFAIVVYRGDWRLALRNLSIFAVVYVVMMSPWWWHNAAKYGQFVRLNLAGGYVLYSGNNPLNKSGGGIAGVDLDPSAFSAIADPVARDQALKGAAVNFIVANPGRTVELMWLKLNRLWRPWPYATEYAKPAIIAVTVATILPLMLLGAAGLVRGIVTRRWRPLVPIVMFMGFLTAVHMVTIGSGRYRFPMEPFLVILAAPVVADVIRRLVLNRRPNQKEPVSA
jgi:SAM-dependent methyltransferase